MLVQWEQDAVKKRELKDTVLEEIVPYYHARLEALVEKNKGNLAVGRVGFWYVLSFFLKLLVLVDLGGFIFRQYESWF